MTENSQINPLPISDPLVTAGKVDPVNSADENMPQPDAFHLEYEQRKPKGRWTYDPRKWEERTIQWNCVSGIAGLLYCWATSTSTDGLLQMGLLLLGYLLIVFTVFLNTSLTIRCLRNDGINQKTRRTLLWSMLAGPVIFIAGVVILHYRPFKGGC